MKILTKRQVDEILNRIAANEIMAIEQGIVDVEADDKATENRAAIAYIVDGPRGIDKVLKAVIATRRRR